MSELAEQKRRNTVKIKRELGSDLCALLDDPTVTDIMLNPDGRLWVRRLGRENEEFGTMDASRAESLMGTIAASVGSVVNHDHPNLDCESPLDGSRFAASLPPVVSAPSFCIRKKAIRVFTLDDYVARGIMTACQASAICSAVVRRDNILIVGGPGAGKTTLANAVISHISLACPSDRLIILEDTWELQCMSEDKVHFRSTDDVSMTALVKRGLRFNGDRVIVGEVRDGAALDLLDSWNTGHPGGVATLHANSASSIFSRLERLVSLASVAPMQGLIVEAVDLVVYIEKQAGSRCVKEIFRVVGHDGMKYLTEPIGVSND